MSKKRKTDFGVKAIIDKVDWENRDKIRFRVSPFPTFVVSVSVCKQKITAKYAQRGTINVLNPDGSILNVAGKHASMDLRVLEDTPEALVEKIEECIEILYAKYRRSAMQSVKNTVAIGVQSLVDLEVLYGEDYLQKNCKSDGAYKNHQRLLRALATMFSAKPLQELTKKDLEKVEKDKPSVFRRYFQEGAKFLDYLRFTQKGVLELPNLFAQYLEACPDVKISNTDLLRAKAVSADCLSMEQFTKLNQIIGERYLTSPDYIAMGLVLYMRLDSRTACQLTWQSIFFYPNNDYMTPCWDLRELKPEHILFCKLEGDTGFVRQLTAPVNGWARALLTCCYAQQIQIHPPERLLSMPIAMVELSTAEKDRLTLLCRNVVLRELHFNFHALQEHATNVKGGGITVLHKTHQNQLMQQCGLGNDPAMVAFMSHKPLTNSVQANCYRSFTDVTAHNYQQTVMRRGELSCNPPVIYPKTVTKATSDGETKAEYRPDTSQGKAEAVIRVTLQPGEFANLSSKYGMKASAKVIHDTEQ